ncbi:MAG: type II TA system antitoxin MqsA family protein [Pseudomonadota bacterium]
MKRCPNCGIGKLQNRVVERTRHVAGHGFAARLPARHCQSCGEDYFDDAVITCFDLGVALKLAEAGVTTGEALKFLRKAAGLSSKDLAALLEVRPETVSRWETGKRAIDRATYTIIRQLVFDRTRGSAATADYLRSLQKPKRLPKRLEIDVDAA